MIETRRTAYDEDGTPVRLTVTVYPADRNQFALEVGKVPPLAWPVPDPSGPLDQGEHRPNACP